MAESGRRLPISRASKSVLEERVKRRKRRERWGDIPREPPRDVELAYGFDVDYSTRPSTLVKSVWGDHYGIALYGRLGLHCYNFQNGTNFKFVRWEKFSTNVTAYINYYITLEAMDPASDNSVFSFQTMFSDVACANGINIRWRTLAGRLKCNKYASDYWDDTAIDDFYKGPMPQWLSDDDLAFGNKKYYVVQESDLDENDWLHLFTEIAFFSQAEYKLGASLPLEIKKIVIETKEEYTTEPREKLKAENAIFYISYKYNGDSLEVDAKPCWVGYHRAIIRKTMDGKPGNMCLEVVTD